MKGFLNGFYGILCLFVLGACGEDAKVNSVANMRNGGDALAPLDCRNSPAKTKLALTQQPEDFRHIPAEELVARHEENPVSLCGLMRANPDVKLVIIQFASLDCYQCLKWIDRLHGEIDQYGLDILQVPILSGEPARSTPDDLLSLKGSLATDALWLRDSTGEVWRFFNREIATPEKVSPMVVVMDGAARGFLISELGQGLKEFIEKANSTLKAGLAPYGEAKK